MNSLSALLLFSAWCPLVHVYINYSTWPAVRTILKFNFMPKFLLDTTLQQNLKFRKNINRDVTCLSTPAHTTIVSAEWYALLFRDYVFQETDCSTQMHTFDGGGRFACILQGEKNQFETFRLYINDRYFGLRPKFVFSGLSLHLTSYS